MTCPTLLARRPARSAPSRWTPRRRTGATKPGCPVPALAGADHIPGAHEVREALEVCDCDLLVHPECCPDCAELER